MLFPRSLGLVLIASGLLSTAQAVAAQAGASATTAASAAVPVQQIAYPGGQGTALAERISALLAEPHAAHAHWGIAITSMNGTPLYGLDEAKLFRPASTAKLFTTAAAMAILGPQFTVNTQVLGDLDRTDGSVTGDLTLLGAGDASFNTTDLPYRPASARAETSQDLQALADQVVARGVHRIAGDIVGNDTLFGREAPPQGWEAEDLLAGFGALPSALAIGDNEVTVTITPSPAASAAPPGAAATGARVSISQLVPYLHIAGTIETAAPGTQPRVAISFPPISEPRRDLDFRGRIASGSAPFTFHLALDDPAEYAAEALKQMLLDRGIAVQGKARAKHMLADTSEPYLHAWRNGEDCGHSPAGEAPNCTRSCPAAADFGQSLASHVSGTLAEDVAFTLKTSANLHAEMLLEQMAVKNSCPGAAAVNGARLVRSWLLQAGLAPDDFVFYDGSGLSVKDLVTPRAEVQLLAYAARQPWFPQWKAALPVGGVDGTLASRFTGAPLQGKVFAKTGTLGESRTLAGYVHSASGEDVIFAILEDDREPGTSADEAVMDRIVAAIAAND
jgi:D-alanyl-D-alanine carboxypeptidase/D-alanyl-D-alanine-endopeptidase (penicillin-binding protein 4)